MIVLYYAAAFTLGAAGLALAIPHALDVVGLVTGALS